MYDHLYILVVLRYVPGSALGRGGGKVGFKIYMIEPSFPHDLTYISCSSFTIHLSQLHHLVPTFIKKRYCKKTMNNEAS